MIRKGFKRNLTREDMWDIDSSETAENVTADLEYEWDKCVKKYFLFILKKQELYRITYRLFLESYIRKLEEDESKSKNVSAIYKANRRNNEEELILNVTHLPRQIRIESLLAFSSLSFTHFFRACRAPATRRHRSHRSFSVYAKSSVASSFRAR
jgi:hypothetical protein